MQFVENSVHTYNKVIDNFKRQDQVLCCLLGTYTLDVKLLNRFRKRNFKNIPFLCVHGQRNKKLKSNKYFYAGSARGGVHHAKYLFLFGKQSFQFVISTSNFSNTKRSKNYEYVSAVMRGMKTKKNSKYATLFSNLFHEINTNMKILHQSPVLDNFFLSSLSIPVRQYLKTVRFEVPSDIHIIPTHPNQTNVGHLAIRNAIKKIPGSNHDHLYIQPTSIGKNMGTQHSGELLKSLSTTKNNQTHPKLHILVPRLMLTTYDMKKRLSDIPKEVHKSVKKMSIRGYEYLNEEEETDLLPVTHHKLYFRTDSNKQFLRYFMFGSQSFSKGGMGTYVCKHNKSSTKHICRCTSKNCQKTFYAKNIELGVLSTKKQTIDCVDIPFHI